MNRDEFVAARAAGRTDFSVMNLSGLDLQYTNLADADLY